MDIKAFIFSRRRAIPRYAGNAAAVVALVLITVPSSLHPALLQWVMGLLPTIREAMSAAVEAHRQGLESEELRQTLLAFIAMLGIPVPVAMLLWAARSAVKSVAEALVQAWEQSRKEQGHG